MSAKLYWTFDEDPPIIIEETAKSQESQSLLSKLALVMGVALVAPFGGLVGYSVLILIGQSIFA